MNIIKSIFTPVPVIYAEPKNWKQKVWNIVELYFAPVNRETVEILASNLEGRLVAIEGYYKPTESVTDLLVTTYITLVIPLVMLVVKAVLHFFSKFDFIDVKSELRQGYEWNSHLGVLFWQKIKTLEPSEKPTYWVLSHPETNEIESKMIPPQIYPDSTESVNAQAVRYTNELMNRFIRLKTICLKNHLDRIVIPPTHNPSTGAFGRFVHSELESEQMSVFSQKKISDDFILNPQPSHDFSIANPDRNELLRQAGVFEDATGLTEDDRIYLKDQKLSYDWKQILFLSEEMREKLFAN